MRFPPLIALALLWSLHIGAGYAATAADTYPSRPVRVVVGFAAGGPTDIQTRVMAQWLTERVGQNFVVENRVGAGGNIATEYVVKSPPDGYTILVIATANAINTTLYPNLPYNFARDIAPVAGLVRIPYIVAIHPAIPAKNIPEFIAYAKANPGKIDYASGGTGGSSHLSVELFKGATGLQMQHIPYKGNAAAYIDVISGRVPLIFADRGSVLQHIQAGALRAIGVTSIARSPHMPELQAVSETLPGFEASAWYGFGVPQGTPPEIIEKLNIAINAGHNDPKMRARFTELDATSIIMSPSGWGNFMAGETVRWGQAVKASGAKPN